VARSFVAVMVVAVVGRGAGVVAAEPGRVLDFQGGLTLARSAGDDAHSLPGLLFELRRVGRNGLWVSAAVGADPTFDMSDPEEGELSVAWAAGVGGGAHVDVGRRLSLHGGGRADLLAGDLEGLRVGPSTSARVVLGHPYGHAMGLEARGAWFRYVIDGDDRWGWHLGLLISGTLSGR
jgi:hypothetical protein